MSFGVYLANIYTQLGLISLLATCAFSWWKGGPAERRGALMLLVVWIGADIARGLNGQLMPTSLLFASDLALSVGFLYVSVRYSSLWLGLAMLFQSFAFALHAVQLDDGDAPRWHGMIVYLLLNNILSYLLLLALVSGALATMRQRRRDRLGREAAEARRFEYGRRSVIRLQPPLAGSA